MSPSSATEGVGRRPPRRRGAALRRTPVEAPRLANMRLVAHIAKRFRDRGIAYSDLFRKGSAGSWRRSTASTWATRRSWRPTRPGGFARPCNAPWPRGLSGPPQPEAPPPARPEPGEARRPGRRRRRPARRGLARDDPPDPRGHPADRVAQRVDRRPSNFSLLQTMSDPEARGTRTSTPARRSRLLGGCGPASSRCWSCAWALGRHLACR